jgi:hypothetical protein
VLYSAVGVKVGVKVGVNSTPVSIEINQHVYILLVDAVGCHPFKNSVKTALQQHKTSIEMELE